MSIEAAFIVPHPPLIIPAVGHGREAEIQRTIDAYDEVARRIAALKPELVIVTSPHAPAYRDWFHISPGTRASGDLSQFRAYDTKLTVEYDAEFVSALGAEAARQGFPAGTAGERDAALDHATYIPLWFIDKFYTDYRAVRIGLSGFDSIKHYQLGQLIDECVEKLGRKAVFVASGDLSHTLSEDGPYGYTPEGPVYDEQITAAMATGDFMRFLTFEDSFLEKIGDCGTRSFQIMAGALDCKAVRPKLLSYEGPFGVGYAVASYEPTGIDRSRNFGELLQQQRRQEVDGQRAREDAYVALARDTIEAYVSGKEPKLPEGLPDEMLARRAGTFVSIHENGKLRGCIGTISASYGCIAEEVLHNAISACSRDPRFDPIQQDELPYLSISVDVLSPAERIDSPDELDVKRYGVIVTNGYRRGLLLPNLDGVDTVEQQISIAKRKAGIAAYESCELQRFEVVRHE